MASDIVVQTRFDSPEGKTVGPTPPRPPVHIFRPGRRRHVIVKIPGATVELVWPARATAAIDVVARGRNIWVNDQLTSRTVGPTPPRPPIDEGITSFRSAPFTIDVATGDNGRALLVSIRPRRVRVNGKEWVKGKTVGPTPPRPPIEPDRRVVRKTLARPSTGPSSNTPPA